MNEQEKFLKDLEPRENGKVDNFEEPLNAESTETKKEPVTDPDDPEIQPESVKDRRHKRLEAKLQAEREANIALAARLETVSEAKKSTSGDATDHLKSIERIYGTDSPEAVAATELLKNAFMGVQKKATDDALEIFRKEQREAVEATKKEEQELDSMIEEIEDEYNIDLTSPKSEELRKGFFKRLEKLSPKDSEGNILHYADHHAVWEDYQSKLPKKTENRAKDLSDRSMVHSTSSESKLKETSDERWLKEAGII